MTRRLHREAHWVRAKVVFDFATAGRWGLLIDSGRAAVTADPPEDPDLQIRTTVSTLADIANGRRPGYHAFLDGEMHVRGNVSLGLELESLFVPRTPRAASYPETIHPKVGRMRWSILRSGPPAAPVVLLFHGLGATKSSMLTTLRALEREYRVLACDLPGFGDSAKPLAAYDAPWYAEQVLALLDHLEIDRAGFVGNSMGGRIALEVGLVAPERCRALVLLAPALAFLRFRQLAPVVRLFRPELSLIPVKPTRGMVLSALTGIFVDSDRVPDGWFEAAADEFFRVWGKARGRYAFASAARNIYLDEPHGEEGFWIRLGTLEVPSLFVFGRGDPLIPSSFARYVAEALPDAEIAIFDDCGHVPQLEEPEATHRLARAILSR